MNRGIDVVDFSVQHPDNWDSPYAKYFAPPRDIGPDAGAVTLARNGLNAVYSLAARRALSRLLDDEPVDLAHVHSFHHYLSGSVIDELAERQIPIVMTLHDYKIACPSWTLFTEGEICRRCVGGSVRHVVAHRCVRNSLPASTLVATESALLRSRKTFHSIDLFLAPSEFVGSLAVESGIPESRVRHVPLFIPDADMAVADNKDVRPPTLLYGGRIDPTKGIRELISAFTTVESEAQLRIAGTGPLEGFVREAADRDGRITYLGKLPRPEWLQELAQARAMIVPSIWEDNAPVVLLEAAARATPVIGSSRGGVPELVLEGESGTVVDPTDVAALTERMEFILVDGERARRLGDGARAMFDGGFTETHHFEKLHRAYGDVVAARRAHEPAAAKGSR